MTGTIDTITAAQAAIDALSLVVPPVLALCAGVALVRIFARFLRGRV